MYKRVKPTSKNYNFYLVWIFQDHFTNTTSYIISNIAKNEIDYFSIIFHMTASYVVAIYGPIRWTSGEIPWLQCRDLGNWMDAGQCSLSFFDEWFIYFHFVLNCTNHLIRIFFWTISTGTLKLRIIWMNIMMILLIDAIIMVDAVTMGLREIYL